MRIERDLNPVYFIPLATAALGVSSYFFKKAVEQHNLASRAHGPAREQHFRDRDFYIIISTGIGIALFATTQVESEATRRVGVAAAMAGIVFGIWERYFPHVVNQPRPDHF